MPIQVKKFNSILDTDLSEAEVDFFSHIDALNITFRGDGTNQRAQNIIGNTLLTNAGLPTGNNEAIGAFYDQVKQRIIWMNWNSDGTHAIFIYNTVPGTFQTLLINGSATDGDILGFTLNGAITSIVIIYQEDADGDLLVYLDSLGRPTLININFFLSTPYTVTKRAFIDLAKAPPRMPVRVTYENDPTTNLNNLQNALFKFRTRLVYQNYLKSVYSTGSITPLPNINFDANIYNTQTTNNRIRCCFFTGDEDVIKIELWGQQSTNDVENSNWFLINSLEKATLDIPDNSVYEFLFYNDGIYTAADPQEIVQLFDYVPIYAQALELLNGNTVIMANITEGYNPVPINMALVANANYSPPVNTVNGLLFFATQTGVDSYGDVGDDITVYLTGAGTNDGSGNPITDLPASNLDYVVDAALANGTSVKFSYSSGAATDAATILAGLVAAAEGQGFTLVGSIGTNSFTVSQATVSLYYAQTTTTLGSIVPASQTNLAYAPRANYDYALCYFDAKGRTIGAQLPVNGSVTTIDDPAGASTPQIVATINSRPPAEAVYYSLVRSPNLTYDKYLVWICNQTFVNTDLSTGNQYAYIGISNMELYNEDITTANPGGTPVVGYTFQQGDRIRFQLGYPVSILPDVNELPTNLDYQIVSAQTDPVLGGVMQPGNFIKILYPTSDISSIFNFGGAMGLTPSQTDNFQRFRFLVYSYAKHATGENTEIYYEFGRMYAIGNPGESNNYHIGSDQSQTPDLSQPAIIKTADGDWFYRQRTIPTGVSYDINVLQAAVSAHSGAIITTSTTLEQGAVSNSSYDISEQIQNGVSLATGGYPQFTGTDELFYNKKLGAQNIRLRGTIPFQSTTSATLLVAILFRDATESEQNLQYLFKNFAIIESNAVQGYSQVVDVVIAVPGQTKGWLIYYVIPSTDTNFTFTCSGYTLRLDVLQYLTILCLDASYDDSYNIVTNSNLRPVVFDENAKQNTYETLLRWSLGDQFGTNINLINRFYDQNQDEIDRSKGSIDRMKSRDRILRIFQQRGCCQKGVYNTFVEDAQGANILTTTDAIITINNTNYYDGEFGMGNHPESLISGKIQDYFFDPVRGYWVRLSQDGLIPISELYKGQYYIRSLITPYLQTWTKADGSNARILGCYNYFEEEAIGLLQGGTNGALTIASYALGFNEKRNAFAGFYSFNQAEWILSAEDNFYTWLNGQLYVHNNSQSVAPYCNYFGVQYGAYITTVFNQGQIEKKTFIGLTELASTIWACPVIYSNEMSYGTQRQQTYLINANFRTLEGLFQASFMRDTFSAGGWINGYRLKGSWLAIQFSVASAPGFVWISEIGIKFIDSPLTAS